MGSSVTSLTSQAPSQLFVGTNNGSLKSLDVASGAINYTYSDPSQSAINAISLGQSGQTYFGDAAGYLYSIDAVKGRLNFSYPGNGAVNQVASNSTSVFLVDSNGGISSFNAATGDYQFQYLTGSSLTQLALDANGSLYAAGVDGKIYDLNAATGKLIGTFAVGAAVKQLTLGGDGNLYALSGNTIYQVNSSTLGLVHSYASDSTVNSFALAAVPEPSSWALMLAGLVMTGLAAQRRNTTRS
jgi:outer membrane protein assembly factor BamB